MRALAYIVTLWLVMTTLLAAPVIAQQGQLGIHAAAPWEYHNIASPAPGTFEQGSINGNAYLSIWSAGFEAYAEGFVDAQNSVIATTIRKQVDGTYYEEWEYVGDLSGDIEGTANLYIYGVAHANDEFPHNAGGDGATAQATGFLIWNSYPDPLNGDQNVYLDESCSVTTDNPVDPEDYNWLAPFSGPITVSAGFGEQDDDMSAAAYYGQPAESLFVECKSRVFIILSAIDGAFYQDGSANILVDGYQSGSGVILGEYQP